MSGIYNEWKQCSAAEAGIDVGGEGTGTTVTGEECVPMVRQYIVLSVSRSFLSFFLFNRFTAVSRMRAVPATHTGESNIGEKKMRKYFLILIPAGALCPLTVTGTT